MFARPRVAVVQQDEKLASITMMQCNAPAVMASTRWMVTTRLESRMAATRELVARASRRQGEEKEMCRELEGRCRLEREEGCRSRAWGGNSTSCWTGSSGGRRRSWQTGIALVDKVTLQEHYSLGKLF